MTKESFLSQLERLAIEARESDDPQVFCSAAIINTLRESIEAGDTLGLAQLALQFARAKSRTPVLTLST